MDTKDLQNDTLIKEWFITNRVKESTRKIYIEAIKPFINMTGKTPNELILEAEADIKSGKLMRERRVRSYLLQFIELLNKTKPNGEPRYSASSVSLRWYTIRSFYHAFEIDLPKNISNGDSLPKMENMNLDFGKGNIEKMIMHSANIRDKAIILAMKSCGMAQKEIRDMTYRHFREGYDAASKIATIRMRRAKVNFDFLTFIDPEGTEAIIEYLKKDGRISEDLRFDSKFDNTPLFTTIKGKAKRKISFTSFTQIFWNLAIRMKQHVRTKGYDTRKFNPIRSHNLRKFFRTTLLHDGMDDSLINYLMGHSMNQISRAYYLSDVQKLKELYMRHMHALAIKSNGVTNDVLKENQKLKSELERIKSTDSTPDDAVMELLNDDRVVHKLFEKFKAMQNGSG